MPANLLLIVLVGAGIGFLGGLLGKGGSALATPFLVALGIPPVIALAAPLPATVPGTLVAARRYRALGLIDRDVLLWSLGAGLPATFLGAMATRWIDASFLVQVTDVVIVALGVRMLATPAGEAVHDADQASHGRIVAVAVVTGLAAGLLANSGGFLLAPLFVAVLGLGIKPAFGTSLAVAAVMAVPGSLVHLALGHLDWRVVLAFAAGSVPLSGLGAKVALRTDAARLERGYGLVLVVLGLAFLVGPHL
ncbi:sulfite exporter TauE/SafE family protein [Aquihabitans sp. G128]|uniref:sulfite exporter TauE/SafE family protein n=1 Tax=Aquihabitans sp. G128 TaxID=2849779 RepID=UPI001C23D491|nr:sulfite exporter TauE/SafE family protein [Aquihabitans sp. G128]QXC62509.1 sulfite exporter TauE/SafE family protein [Aquihabitans sp. G128]